MSTKPSYRIGDPCVDALQKFCRKLIDLRSDLDQLKKDHPDHSVDYMHGLLDSGIISMSSIIESKRKKDISFKDQQFGESFNFNSRGIGTEHGIGCFVCGSTNQAANLAAYVASRHDGDRIVAEFFNNIGAKVDFRTYEPNYVQVKVGACVKHIEHLERLHSVTSGQFWTIREYDVKSIINHVFVQTGGEQVAVAE